MFKNLVTKNRTLRSTVIASLLVSAVPASATVVVQNFMKASFTHTAACVTKIAGNDASDTIATSDVTGTVSDGSGVNVLNESLTLKAYVGDRTVATDSIRIKNSCATAMKVRLQAEAGVATSVTSGDWTGMNAFVYLGKATIVSAPANGAPTALADLTVGAQWDQAPLKVTPTGAVGTVINSSTGTVTIPVGAEIQIGIYSDSASNAPTSGTAQLNFTVNASI